MATKTRFTPKGKSAGRTGSVARAPATRFVRGKPASVKIVVKKESGPGSFVIRGDRMQVRIETRGGKKYAVLPAAEFRRLQRAALGSDRPPRPVEPPLAGAVDALAFADATIAESIVRDRRAVGLTQKELAERAGIRVEVLNRAENGVVTPSVRTLTKIENALVAAGLRRKPGQ